MKIIYSNIIPFKGFTAINLFGVLFARKGVYLTRRIINHESIHTAQMKEMLYIFFYLWYLIEWLFRLVLYCNFDKAYRNISFEREAYHNDYDMFYDEYRKHYSWLNYIKNNL